MVIGPKAQSSLTHAQVQCIRMHDRCSKRPLHVHCITFSINWRILFGFYLNTYVRLEASHTKDYIHLSVEIFMMCTFLQILHLNNDLSVKISTCKYVY